MGKAEPLPSPLFTARDKTGKSQADYAARLGVSQATVSNWENGESTPHPSQWTGIAEVYGLSLAKLLAYFGRAAS